MTEREALKLALDALEQLQGGCTDSDDGTVEAITVWCPEVIDAIKEALAQPEQKPFFTEANGFSQTFVPKDRQRQAIISLTEQCAALIQERDELQKQVWQYEKLAQPELCKYGQEPKSCTSSPMDCQCAIDATFAQPEQEVDWEKLYRLEVKKKEALAAKYERDIKPLTKIVPMTQPEQEPVACVQDLDEVKRKHLVYEKGMDWKDPLYTTPPQSHKAPALAVPSTHSGAPNNRVFLGLRHNPLKDNCLCAPALAVPRLLRIFQ